MSLDPAAVVAANAALWQSHPELGGRQLTTDPADAALRQEWLIAYNAELAKKPPTPAVVPVAAVVPAAAGPVMACAGASTPPVKVSDCKDVKNQVQEGDIVLRGEHGNEESEFVGKVSGCDYSHAGIVARDSAGQLVVVDAYPGRGPAGGNEAAVAAHPVDDFFCGHGATHGVVARPKDCAKAQLAAQWAMAQTIQPDYKFNLWDPWNSDPKQLYCSDFVHQSFQSGGGLDLVPVKTDLLDTTHRATTLSEARKMAANDNRLAKLASDSKIESELRKRTGGSSEYITPCQVAMNTETQVAAVYVSPVAATGADGKKGGP
jgi:Permuted papain-like amidase enzyme, YaeF/YiiX, C92 family